MWNKKRTPFFYYFFSLNFCYSNEFISWSLLKMQGNLCLQVFHVHSVRWVHLIKSKFQLSILAYKFWLYTKMKSLRLIFFLSLFCYTVKKSTCTQKSLKYTITRFALLFALAIKMYENIECIAGKLLWSDCHNISQMCTCMFFIHAGDCLM